MVKQYTPEELTQLHQVLYEILEEIVRICDKHNIPYFVIGGTAIGALYDKAILPSNRFGRFGYCVYFLPDDTVQLVLRPCNLMLTDIFRPEKPMG